MTTGKSIKAKLDGYLASLMTETVWPASVWVIRGAHKTRIEPVVEIVAVGWHLTKIVVECNYSYHGSCITGSGQPEPVPPRQYGIMRWLRWRLDGSRYGYDAQPRSRRLTKLRD